MNKFDNKIAEYRKLYNLTEQETTGLQTGNVITNFFSNLKKYKLSNLKEQKDFIIKLTGNIDTLKNNSNPKYWDALTKTTSTDKQLWILELKRNYLNDVINHYENAKAAQQKAQQQQQQQQQQQVPLPTSNMPTSNDVVLYDPKNEVENTWKTIIANYIQNDNIAEIKKEYTNIERSIKLKKELEGKRFIGTLTNNKQDSLSKLDKNIFVVYAIDTFSNLKFNNQPPQFSLVKYFTDSDNNKKDFLASNLTIEEAGNVLIKTLGGAVSVTKPTLAKDIANRLVDKTVKGIGSAIKGAASYAVGTQTVRRM